MFDHPMPRAFQNRFSTQYRCYSVSMLAGPNDRSDVEKGGKSMIFLHETIKLFVLSVFVYNEPFSTDVVWGADVECTVKPGQSHNIMVELKYYID